jgi:hypothetical protein
MVATRRALRGPRPRHRCRRTAGSHRGIRHRRPDHRPGAGGPARARSPARWACPVTSTCSSSSAHRPTPKSPAATNH